MKFKRNQPCPCGSGKKYKYCYDGINITCPIKLQEQRQEIIIEHNNKEKIVFDFFNNILKETNIILLRDKENNDQIPLRIQMIICFSLIDVFANYWYEFLGKTGRTNDRAKEWYSSFCISNRNKFYKNYWIDLSAENLYKFRNALVHFFGLGEQDDISIILAPNQLSNELRREYQKSFPKTKKVIIIRPKDFYEVIKEGAKLMLGEWAEIIKQSKTDGLHEQNYIRGIERIWKKIQQEGAFTV